MIDEIDKALKEMEVITLQQMQDIRLMDRVDFKFVAPVSCLPLLLLKMRPYFKVQINNGKAISLYSTQYLDTESLDMFLMHQNGKLNRQKVRIRSYVESDMSFLEVKNKNNKGRTTKVRIPTAQSHIHSSLDFDEEISFLEENSLFCHEELHPSLSNTFKRITLVNNHKTERITIDFDLAFENYYSGIKKDLNQFMVLELKQDGWNHSVFRDILLEMQIKQYPFSKYCMGFVSTCDNIKYNKFKGQWILINKLLKNDTIGSRR